MKSIVTWTQKRNKAQGFTIVELLIVIVVIAILAAIAIIAYNGITNRAIESSMKSDLRGADSKVETDKIMNGGYSTSNATLGSSGDNVLKYYYTDGQYCLSVTNPRVGSQYHTDSEDHTIRDGPCEIAVGPEPGIQVTYKNFGSGGGVGAFCALTRQSWVACWMIDSSFPERTVKAIPQGDIPSGTTFKMISSSRTMGCGIASNNKWYCWFYNIGGGQIDGPYEMPQGDLPSGVTLTNIAQTQQYVGLHSSTGCIYIANVGSTAEPQLQNCIESGNSLRSWSMGGSSPTGTGYHECIATVNFPVCYGANASGQLGDNTTTSRQWFDLVYQGGVLNGKSIAQIDVGGGNTCAVTTDGGLYCWGANGTQDALGNNSASPAYTSVAIQVAQGQIPGGSSIKKVTVGGGQACALTAAEWVYCWGWNSYGAVGDNSFTSPQRAPRAVVRGEIPVGVTIKDIAASVDSNTCAIASDNNLYCWGRHSASTQTSSPVKYADAFYP